MDVNARTIADVGADAPRALSSGAIVATGWAVDRHANDGTGIGGVHLWATRRDNPGAAAGHANSRPSPQFLGVARFGVAREDLTARYGSSGWRMVLPPLAPGDYDLLVYAWYTRTGRFEAVQTVRVVIQ